MKNSTISTLFTVFILCILLSGCDPADSITLINDTSEIINVTIKSTISRSEEKFQLHPEGKKPVVIFGLIHTNIPEKMKQIMTENMKLEDKCWIINMSSFKN